MSVSGKQRIRLLFLVHSVASAATSETRPTFLHRSPVPHHDQINPRPPAPATNVLHQLRSQAFLHHSPVPHHDQLPGGASEMSFELGAAAGWLLVHVPAKKGGKACNIVYVIMSIRGATSLNVWAG